jgi:hypothetical protein
MSVTNETIDLIKSAHAGDISKAGVIAGVGPTAGFQNWNLEPAAKNLFPVTTKLRNEIPRVANGNGGSGSNYKVVTGFGSDNEAGIVEGARGYVQTPVLVDKVAYFRTLGEEGSVTFEAQGATTGFEDSLAENTMRVLKSTMEQEERVILAGRGNTLLPATLAPSVAASAGGALPAGNYTLIVRSLTSKGALASSVALGVKLPYTATAADGSQVQRTGYFGTASPTLAVNGITANQQITATVPAVKGASGYAWFFGPAGNERLVAVTSLSVAVISALNATSQLHTALAAFTNPSVDPLVFDGLLTIASDMSAYNLQMSGAANLSGSGGQINELDAVLQSIYDGIRVACDKILVSSDIAIAVNAKIMQGAAHRFVQMPSEVVGGARVVTYVHPITGGTLSVEVHPFLPKGTMLVYATKVDYENANIANVMQIKTQRDYYQIAWPQRTRKYEFGVYVEETLQHYLPNSMAVISNIKA